MKGNFHVQFLGGGAAATPPCYPAGGRATALPTATSLRRSLSTDHPVQPCLQLKDWSMIWALEQIEPLRKDPAKFRAMKIEGGTIAWDNAADIDPDVLYYNLKPAWSEEAVVARAKHSPKRSEEGG